MKCPRCGKVYEDDLIEVCEECGYNFAEGKKISQILDSKSDPDVDETKESDLYDFPILSFVLGLLGLLLPIFICSFFAIKLSKKPAKVKLEPLSKIGKILGYMGYFASVVFIFFMIVILF